MTDTPSGSPDLEQLLANIQPRNADLLAALHRVQEALGYVPPEAIPLVAAKLHTTPASVHGAISFYSEFRTSPPPQRTIGWCSGPACRLKGSENIRRALEAVLGIEMGQSSEDNAFGLRLVQCDGTCRLAPLVRLDGRPQGPLSVGDAIRLARELKGDGRL